MGFFFRSDEGKVSAPPLSRPPEMELRNGERGLEKQKLREL